MALLGDLVVRIVGDTAQFVRSIDQSERKLNKFEKDLKKITDTMSKAGKKMSTFVTLPILAIGAAAVKAAADMEMQEAAFTTLLGSAEQAKSMLTELEKFAASTPFQLTDLAQGTKTMLAFGIEASKVLPYLRQLGDVAQGDSQRFGQLTLAFSQIQATGRLMGQDLLQLINAGFNPLQIISEKTGETMAELKKRMEAGGISAVEVSEAFKIATSEGGRFFGGMEKASKTLTGLISTLKDNVVLMARSFGEMLLPMLKDFVARLTSFAQRFADMDDRTKKIIITIAALAAAAGPLLLIVSKLIVAIQTIIPIFTAFNAVLAANPILAIVTAVALLGTAAYLLVKNWEKVAPFFKKVWNTIIDIFDFAVGPIIALIQEIINVAKEWLIDKFIVIAEGVAAIVDSIVVAFGGEAKIHKKVATWIDTWEIPARKRLSFSLRDLKVDVDETSGKMEDAAGIQDDLRASTDDLTASTDDLTEATKNRQKALDDLVESLREEQEIYDIGDEANDFLKAASVYVDELLEKLAEEDRSVGELIDQYYKADAVLASQLIPSTEELARKNQELVRSYLAVGDMIAGYATPIFEAFGQAMVDQKDAAEILKEAFKDLIVSILRALARKLVIMGTEALIPLPGLFNPAGAAAAFAGAAAASIAAGVVAALQEGGVTKAAIPAVLHPNEAVLPLGNREAMAQVAEAIANARAPSVSLGEQMIHVTLNVGGKTFYDDISRASRDGRVVIDARNVR